MIIGNNITIGGNYKARSRTGLFYHFLCVWMNCFLYYLDVNHSLRYILYHTCYSCGICIKQLPVYKGQEFSCIIFFYHTTRKPTIKPISKVAILAAIYLSIERLFSVESV